MDAGLPEGFHIDVYPFCRNCPEFEVDVKHNILNVETFLGEVKEIHDRTFTCIHMARCAEMKEFMVKKFLEQKKEENK